MRSNPSPSHTKSCDGKAASRRECSCGVETAVSAPAKSGATTGSLSDRPLTPLRDAGKPVAREGSLADRLVEPQPLPPVPDTFGSQPPEALLDADRANDATGVDPAREIEALETSPPRLLPTPVSEPRTSVPALPSSVPEVIPDTQVPADGPRVPEPPPSPLPDILVDPFIDDVGQKEPTGSRGIALAGGRRSVPENALRLKEPKEPKRFAPSRKSTSPSQSGASKGTRIVIKRTSEQKIVDDEPVRNP